MVSRSILAVAAVAGILLGAEAGPCRPTTDTSSSIENETSSTVLSVPESTTATTLIETTPTAVAETTSTILDVVTSTTLAASTTTAAAPNCVATQVVSNPGFDDSDKFSPWMNSGSAFVINDNWAPSAPNVALFGFLNGQGSNQVVQNLPVLNGNYKFSYQWHVAAIAGSGSGFSCVIQPKIGNDLLDAVYPYQLNWWQSESQTWSSRGTSVAGASISISVECSGEYDQLNIYFDDITLTRVCGDEIRGD
ncbi:hypothetical protein FLAG1_06078 [Fusarium langsethiae]|uniref:CBM-cenC domain-containing protein n=1 Tax=Fusarium langsethiae TaxID=179993 RepID=A0A0M9EW04_FUSLA|nr:hypothetical protein FLAG1_06078 [Fusarium langsethiae]GKU04501.1 unnamed protein product [Fusarium langsethiae]GKU20466.1 unnamed protein product [Fusarium langsethiae]